MGEGFVPQGSGPQRTTRGDVALSNLDDRIRSLDERVQKPGSTLASRAQLIDLLLTRTQFTSRFDDFAHVRDLAERAPESARSRRAAPFRCSPR
jgi:hypothetical protein